MAKLIKLQVGINTIYKKENSVKGRYGWQTALPGGCGHFR